VSQCCTLRLTNHRYVILWRKQFSNYCQ